MIASALALVVLAFLVVYSVARSRATKEAMRRSEARKGRNRPQTARPRQRVPAGRRSNLLVALLLMLAI